MTRGRLFRVAFLVLLVTSTTIGGMTQIARQKYSFPGPLEQPRNVVVPHGDAGLLAQTLLQAGVIRSVTEFRIAAALTRGDGPLHAGELAFPVGASLAEVLAILRTARPVGHKLTIPEGLTAAQIMILFEQAPSLTGDTPMPAEGAVLPETYSYEIGTTRAVLIERATAAMDHAVTGVWDQRDRDIPLASRQQLVILASIVERETAKPEERSRVAAAFLNRLRQGMKLQSDPTVIYAASGGSGVLGRLLTRADLDRPNPYNTYAVTGLPPGPIDSPGIAALQAVAHPAQTDELYFVADGAGGHLFARTLEDHQRNVARWRALNVPVPVNTPTR